MSDSILRIKLFEDVANHIVDCIRDRTWSAGMRIPSEPTLAKHFDVSRSTVRTAIKSLQAAGVLYSLAGSGTYVSENAPLILETRALTAIMANPDNLTDLIGARYVLEPQLAALAAKHATDEEIAHLFGIIDEMEADTKRYNLMSCGYDFHQAVAKAAHNEVLFGFYLSAANQLRSVRVLDTLTLETFVAGIEDHRRIAKAIADKDPDTASRLMREHLQKDYAVYLQNI